MSRSQSFRRESKAAIKAAIQALKDQRQRIAFDANVQRIYKVNTPYAVKCLQRYEDMTEQIEELEALLSNPPAPPAPPVPLQGSLF